MCVSCHMGAFRWRKVWVNYGNFHDAGPLIEVILGKFAFSVGLWRVRGWFKPEFYYKRGGYGQFAKGSDKATFHKSPGKVGVMWGVFHFVLEIWSQGVKA